MNILHYFQVFPFEHLVLLSSCKMYILSLVSLRIFSKTCSKNIKKGKKVVHTVLLLLVLRDLRVAWELFWFFSDHESWVLYFASLFYVYSWKCFLGRTKGKLLQPKQLILFNSTCLLHNKIRQRQGNMILSRSHRPSTTTDGKWGRDLFSRKHKNHTNTKWERKRYEEENQALVAQVFCFFKQLAIHYSLHMCK